MLNFDLPILFQPPLFLHGAPDGTPIVTMNLCQRMDEYPLLDTLNQVGCIHMHVVTTEGGCRLVRISSDSNRTPTWFTGSGGGGLAY